MSYTLTTERMRCVKKNERGVVTKRVQYKKGDKIDPDMLVDGRLDQLVASGALVDSEAEQPTDDGTAEQRAGQATGSVAGPVGAALNPANPGDPVTDEQHDEAAANADANADEDEEAELELLEDHASSVDSPDSYDSMAQDDLHNEVAARGVETGGSDELLKRRLRQNDADNA